MSQSCTSSPTLTTTREVITQTFTTSTTSSVTTLPPTTTTSSTVAPCSSLPSGVTGTCIPSTVPVTVIIPGATQTVQVPITLPVDITSTTVATLFGTSCTTIINNPPPITTPPPSSSPSTTTSPPVSTSESTSTQSNGSLTAQTVTQTSTQPVNTIVSDGGNGRTNVAPIIGGVVGGFFGLLAIVALIWFILKRRRRWDDIFDKDDDEIIAAGARRAGRFSLDADMEPKPYQYGLVGQALAPSATSPPNTPPMRPSAGQGAPDLRHARTSSLTPLNAFTAASTPLTSATSLSSRPSTAGSQQQLFPPPLPTQTYPPPQQQQQQQARPPDVGRTTSTANTLSHTHSQGSGSFTSPAVSLAHWNGAPGPGYNNGVMPGMGMGMGIGAGGPSPSDEHLYVGGRSGSPTSIQETQMRRLQVANALPRSPVSESFDFEFADMYSSSLAAAGAASVSPAPVVQRDGKGRIRMPTGVAPVVHTDAGRVPHQQPAAATAGASSAGPSGTSPPSYEE